jgi:hypothetical protein
MEVAVRKWLMLGQVAAVLAVMGLVALPAVAKKKKGGGGGGGGNQAPQVFEEQDPQPPPPQPQPTDNPQPAETSPSPAPPPTAPDKSAIISARQDVETTAKAFDDMVAKLKEDFEASDDFVAARKAVEEAKQAVEAAKAAIIERLKDKSAYVRAVKAADDAKAKVADLRSSDSTDPKQLSAAAKASFDAEHAVTQIVQGAMVGDANVAAAQDRLTQATAKVMQMRADFRSSMPQNADYIAAKKARDDAANKFASMH